MGEKREGWKQKKRKRDDPLSLCGLTKKPTEERFWLLFWVFFPCHAFNGGLFPVGSALEVAPASVSLIFGRQNDALRLAVG